MSVLILAGLKDIEIDAVAVRLNRRGSPFFRLNTFTIDCHQYSQSWAHGHARADALPFRVDEVTTVWNRLPINIRGYVTKDDPPPAAFVKEECFWFLQNIGALVPHARWINPPVEEERANCKVRQLSLAQKVGLRVPRTLLSNDPLKIRELANEVGTLVYKAIFHSGQITTGSDLAVYTTELSASSLEHLSEIRTCPGFFQAKIAKRSDLRVIVIGDRIFPVRIKSQEHPLSQIDWRRAPFDEVDCESCSLPLEVCDGIRQMMAELGIVTAAMDFVEGTDGHLYFLEVNPGGRWLQFSARTVEPIAEALVDCLVGR